MLQDEQYSIPLHFQRIRNNIEQFKNTIGINNYRQFGEGDVVDAKIVNIFDYGLICELENTNQVGLLHVSKLDSGTADYDIGDSIKVQIGKYQVGHKKYRLLPFED